MKKTIEQTKKWLLKNRIDYQGNLDLKGLDFSNFEGNVYISEMKVKNDLHQNEQEVKGDLQQGYQEVTGFLNQRGNKVEGNLSQDGQKVGGYLRQDVITNYHTMTKEELIEEIIELKGE